MKRQNIVRIVYFLLFLSICWLLYSYIRTMREGLSPAKCSDLNDCKTCTEFTTGVDGACAWDSKIGKCKKSETTDDPLYVSTTNTCSSRTDAPKDAIWVDSALGCPVCPNLTILPNDTGITKQA